MRSLLSSLILPACAMLAVASMASAGDALKVDLRPCLSNGTHIGGVNSCGKIWKLRSGSVQLDSDGTLKVDVRDLVLNDETTGQFSGTPDGVDAVAAAVICTGPAGAAVAAQTEPVTLVKTGDVRIHARVNLTSCTAPIVVLRERNEGRIGGWLAATGF